MSGELKSGWRIILAAHLGNMLSVTHIQSLGVMIVPLQAEFGWSREQISLGMSIVSMLALPLVPLAGMLMDRFGARTIAIPAVLLYSSAMALLSQAGPGIGSWYLGWSLLGLCYVFVQTPWVIGMARNFEKSRGMALSLCLMGTGMAAFLTPMFAGYLTANHGWRTAYLGLGAVGIAIVFPAVLRWFVDRPERTRASSAPASGPAPASGADRAAIFRSRRYWQLAVISLLATTGMIGLSVHLVSLLVDSGIEYQAAAAVAGLIGIGNICGRLLGGILLDRIHGSFVGCFALSCPIVACLLLLFGSGGVAVAGTIAFLIGLALGTETDVVAYVTSRYFGLRHFGLAFSSLTTCMIIGVGLGPWLAGMVHDHTGGYQMFIQALIAAFGLALLLFATLGRYPDESVESRVTGPGDNRDAREFA